MIHAMKERMRIIAITYSILTLLSKSCPHIHHIYVKIFSHSGKSPPVFLVCLKIHYIKQAPSPGGKNTAPAAQDRI